MKTCELCKAKARMYCASDQASLCWDCDAKVHSANFLVARHSRNLLCHVCQSPTPWSASGGKLGPTVCVCEQCVDRGRFDDSGEEESPEEVEEEVVQNQVVPWSPPSPAESSSSIEEAVSGGNVVVSRKRLRIDNCSCNHQSNKSEQEDQSCASSHLNICTPPPSDSVAGVTEALSRRKTTPPQRKTEGTEPGRVEACGSGILDSLRRFHREETGPGEEMAEICTSPGPSI